MTDTETMTRLREVFVAVSAANRLAVPLIEEAIGRVGAGEVTERYIALHFKMGEPTLIQVLARAEVTMKQFAEAVKAYRRAIIRAHGGPAPSVNDEGGAVDDGEDRT